MLNEMKIINEWPDTFEGFIAKYSTQGSPRMIEDYLVFQAIEHYFPIKQCRTCRYFYECRDDYNIYYGLCKVGIIWDKLYGTVSPNFGCSDWRARE